MFVAVLCDLLGFFVRRLTHCLRTYQFECLHRANSTNISYQLPLRLPLKGTLPKPLSEQIRPRAKVFLFDNLKHGQRGFARGRITTKRTAKLACARRIHNLSPPRDRSHWKSAGQGLGHCHHVGFESKSLTRKHGACASKPSLHFVGYHQNAIFLTDRAKYWIELGRWSHKSALA